VKEGGAAMGISGYLTVVKRVITPKIRDAIGSAKLK
jgi:hypothetical protein